MEFVDGATLREAIAAGGMAQKEALALVPRICKALQYAHDQGSRTEILGLRNDSEKPAE